MYLIRYKQAKEYISNRWDQFKTFLENTKFWFFYRLHPGHRYHMINTHLGYDYHEIDDRMLHGMFSLLVEYVEVELAHMWSMHSEVHSKRAAGLAYLDSQISDILMEEGDAWTYREIRELYLWWVDERPDRMDPFELIADDFTKTIAVHGTLFSDKDSPEHKELDRASQQADELETSYHMQDQEQLIRLIRIRRSLWT